MKEYKFNLLFANISLIFLLTGLLEFVGASDREVTLLLMISWYCGTHGFSNIAYILEDEIVDGTIVNIFQSKISLYYVIWMRAGIQIMVDSAKAFLIFAVIIIIKDIRYSISLIFILSTLGLVLLSIIITYGIGLMIGSLAILYRKMIAVAGVFYYFVLFFSGVIYDVRKIALLNMVNMLFPFASLRIALTSLLYQNNSGNFALLHLCILLIIWMALGTAMFKYAIEKGLKTGSVYGG